MEKEIEVKIKVSNLNEIAKKLEHLGCVFSGPTTQDDTVFINHNRPFIEFTVNDPILRIRKSDGRIIFTYKQGVEMACIEREVVVDDAEQLEDILKFLGFRPEVRILKTRSKTRYKDYEICLDNVDGLGSFIELEKITNEDSEKVQKEMVGFLEELGINTEERVMSGYDTLMWLKNNGKS